MPTENQFIEEMLTLLTEKIAKDYQKGKTKRDAHPKCLGMVKANFKVIENIPLELKSGVFQSPKSFKSLIRFSNSSGNIQSDKNKDFRGFAIKLLNVEGVRFTDYESNSQDFMLMSKTTMPLGKVRHFRDIIYYSIKWNPLVMALVFLFTGRINILLALMKGRYNDTSPLDIKYFSTTPYMLGVRKVKYKIAPTSTIKSKLPKELTNDYLTTNMQDHLNEEVATFDFFVQQYKDEKYTPIEDAGIEWKAAVSPFIKVGEIEIPVQQFNTKERFDFAEQLSFSPANALKVHQPIGGLNRARVVIYRGISTFRHQQNDQELKEPELSEYDKL